MLQADPAALLLAAIREGAPAEVCGFLLADPAGRQQFRRVPNYSEVPGAFLIAPTDYRRVHRDAAERGLKVMAVVHSHSASLDLSEADRRDCRLVGLPFVVVLICDGAIDHRVHYPDE